MGKAAAVTVLLVAACASGQGTANNRDTRAGHYPELVYAELPLYPSLAWTAHISGAVQIRITVENGAVVDAEVESSTTKNKLLAFRSVENVNTWRFRPERRTTFAVNYVYRIEGKQTPLPENPRVELDLPLLVKITARPFKPSCFDCSALSQTGICAAAKMRRPAN